MANYLQSILIYTAISTSFTSSTVTDYKSNNAIQQKVKEAGCPFVAPTQLLEKNVCLMPDYASNEPPKNLEGNTNVSIYVLQAFVLEVDEMKNTVTVQLLQYLHWVEHRIRAKPSTNNAKNKIKIPMRNIHRLWHPDVDIYTKDLKEWKSLYDPSLYQELYLAIGQNQTIPRIELSALKSWRATIFCKYDFSSFPFDTQHCAFLQFGISQDIRIQSSCRQISVDAKQKLNGFDVSLDPAGPLCDHRRSLNNVNELLWMDTGFNITLKRKIRPYLYQYYFPSSAIVVVSQISFIIPLSSVPGRVGLVVTQFLTLTNIFIHQMVRYF